MVTSRTITSSKPVFPYRGRAYSILYFGTSARGAFTTEEAKLCMSGIFCRTNSNSDFTAPAKRLVAAGLLREVSPNKWLVTREGVRAMIDAAAYYREYKWRTLGLSYMEQVHARMAAIHATSLSVMEKLDLEDKILEEVSSKIAKRRAKRNKRKTR